MSSSSRLVFSLCAFLLSGCGAERSSDAARSARIQSLQVSPSSTHGLEHALPASEQTVSRGSAYQVVGSIDGFFSHIQPGLVRGSVQLERDATDPTTGDVQLALRVHDGTAWVDQTVRDLRLTRPFYGEIELMLPAFQAVRFEVRVRQQPFAEQHLGVSFVRLFGAECVPDASTPGTCL
ncbi:hypothetical protein POL68_32575 [Stigmatella sp. ncwal1]|uniref:Lipoprotein n=1 Tax=Stigmatella ashevillensis TaxID=2995309 RepID=A0ABT5DHY8_9BACT|nr:hypothetical protein [Stigmatella ashevillena]MDC0713243.1 hypothetical protein [Stigmatella ashevillena]